LVFLLAFSILGVISVRSVGASSPAFGFTNYEVARSADQSFAGVTCPNSGTNCWNWNGEPNIATAPDGTIYATSENTAFNHPSECNDPTGGTISQTLYICGGTGAWKSTDRGNHFTTLTSPNTNFQSGYGITLWGGDTHVAVAPAKNLNGQYNVYVVSLEAAIVGLVGVGESTSQDGGQTWSNNPTAIQFTNPIANPLVEDRPWVAAYGSTEVCVSVHEGAIIGDVWCSYNSGLTFTQVGSAFDAAHAWLTAETSIPGAIHIDPRTGYMYVPFSGLASATEAANPVEVACGGLTGINCPFKLHAVYMAVSTNSGLTFTDQTVYVNPNNQVNYGSNFLAMTLDRAGNLYEAFSDGVNLLYSYSTDNGQTWHGPYQVNQAPSSWAIEPWLTAGDPGKVDIVWYGTNNCGAGITDADNCQTTASWSVFFAQNRNVFSSPTGFTQQQATGVIHAGPVCLNGGGCQSYRGLFDDFGVTADPVTGLATIVYDNDMYTPTNSNNLPNPDCTSQYTTSSDPAQQNCVHTDIAHQTSGTGVFKKHSLLITQQSLTQASDLTHATYNLQGRNDGEVSLTALSVSLAGVLLPLTLSSALPLQPGNTISGQSVISLQTVPLLLGTAYPAAVTATFDDGTTLTQTTTVAYTLA
jgi:hypothetical protein